MGRRLNDGLIPPCLDENLKCSVNCCIVCLLIIHSTTMTEQYKITIFDALIKPFLRDDSQTSEHQEDNLFAPAIRSSLTLRYVLNRMNTWAASVTNELCTNDRDFTEKSLRCRGIFRVVSWQCVAIH